MVASHKMFTLLDGFSGYNEERVAPEDHRKHVYYGMGSLCYYSHVIWTNECTIYFLKRDNDDLCGIFE